MTSVDRAHMLVLRSEDRAHMLFFVKCGDRSYAYLWIEFIYISVENVDIAFMLI